MYHKVLLVDDSLEIRLLYRDIFEEFDGCSIIEAVDGQEGLNALAKNPDTDLVLLDIDMPKMDGLTFLRKVKSCDHLRKIPIVVISSDNRRSVIATAKALGAQGYITKPFLLRDLLNMIENIK